MQVQRKNENGVESNCLLLILLMILNFFGVLLEIKLLKRGKLLNFEFIKVSWLIMEKCLSDELNNKMTNLKYFLVFPLLLSQQNQYPILLPLLLVDS